jgi:small conductance mechanosensitive channel
MDSAARQTFVSTPLNDLRRRAVQANPNVAADPAPQVSLLDMKLNGPVIAVRRFAGTEHCWQVYFDTNEAIGRTAREAGWAAPTPVQITRLVHA